MDVTIVIPAKNGGELFDKVLAKVFEQKTKYEYEVICVDSGSTDNTLDIIKNILVSYMRLHHPNSDMEKPEIMVQAKVQASSSYSLLRMHFLLIITGLRT